MNTAKHIMLTQRPKKTTFFLQKTTSGVSIKQHLCKYCDKPFTHIQSMYRHIKYTCNKNKDEDLKELVRLLNLQIKQKDSELEYQKKQIDKLMDKLQVTNHITNTTK